MVTLLLRLLRLLPLRCGAHRHIALENLALRHQVAVYKKTRWKAAWSGTGLWHPAWKLVKSLPMGSPSQDRDAGSNPAGATNLTTVRDRKRGRSPFASCHGMRAQSRAQPGRDGLSRPGQPLCYLGSR